MGTTPLPSTPEPPQETSLETSPASKEAPKPRPKPKPPKLKIAVPTAKPKTGGMKFKIPVPTAIKPRVVVKSKPMFKPPVKVRLKPRPTVKVVSSKVVPKKKCKRCEKEHEVEYFPRSPTAKGGRLHICKDCFGAAISNSRRHQPAELLPSSADAVNLANRALRVANGHAGGRALSQGAVSAVARRMILALAEVGVHLEQVIVDKNHIKTVYRVEEDVEL
jgi:hypothetical protein